MPAKSGARIAHSPSASFQILSTDFNGTIQPAMPSVAAASVGTLTVTVPSSFKPGKPVVINVDNSVLETAGISMTTAECIGPASGSYAAGNKPQVVISYINPTAAPLTPASRTLDLIQF